MMDYDTLHIVHWHIESEPCDQVCHDQEAQIAAAYAADARQRETDIAAIIGEWIERHAGAPHIEAPRLTSMPLPRPTPAPTRRLWDVRPLPTGYASRFIVEDPESPDTKEE